jgi:O-antigen biosynthesis protein WbqP
MKSVFDRLLSFVLILLLFLPIALISLLVKITSTGPIIYWSDRIGQFNVIFKMPKFRSMLEATPDVPTHLLNSPELYLTPIGKFLRLSSLDEIPQLYSILKGDMSFVGPRPALYNQDDLIAIRTENGIDSLKPGITGWAQINGRDELSIPEKVALDLEYSKNQSFWFDMKILWLTFTKVLKRENVIH